ncbi:hypothetical protein Tsubulata_013129 [Turnera subulata]|uniref:CRAL-TRIO domain-containing protein n=1 Tax=Turnera subulata TaxID=218843 RepID=A0A9Q0FE60_9ROSI|nr:hypothetical protein Tsubulata_013129 [Turnera subulata]
MATEVLMVKTEMEQNSAQMQPQKEPIKDIYENGVHVEDVGEEKRKDDLMGRVESDRKEIEEIEVEKKANRIEKQAKVANGEESGHRSELKDYEKKALFELREMLEEAILGNELFNQKKVQEKEVSVAKDADQKSKEMDKTGEEKPADREIDVQGEKKEGSTLTVGENEQSVPAKVEAEKKETSQAEDSTNEGGKENASRKQPAEGVGLQEMAEEKGDDVDKNVQMWGVPLMPSKGDTRTDVILLKFLRATEFQVSEAFRMLRDTLQWRKENKVDSIMEEDSEAENIGSMFSIEGCDLEGHPVCYNMIGALGNDELLGKASGSVEKRHKFLRWRIQLMETCIQKLDFRPGGVSAFVLVNDLKDAPGPTKRELRVAMSKTFETIQDNYPEVVAKHVFVNVPFWYYAFSAMVTPFMAARDKNKYIAAEQIPVQYGGLKSESDSEFSVEDAAKVVIVKGGSTEIVEIPAPEAGSTIVWELSVSGWEVNYKEEFIPTDERSYAIIVQRDRKLSRLQKPISNSFKNNEAGKIVITIENTSYYKKSIIYRYKSKKSSSASS